MMDTDEVRKAAVAGSFYSADKDELIADVEALLEKAGQKEGIEGRLRAIIVPHAGYVYSGEVAAHGFVQVSPDADYKRIILIGASHRIRFNAFSICTLKAYETPLGKVEVDRELANNLMTECPDIVSYPEAHVKEHCLEVQLPYLQQRLKKPFKILPVIIGTDDISMIQRVARVFQAYFNKENLFVISTDFSHYPNYSDAVIQDEFTVETIMKNSPDELLTLLEKHKQQEVPGMVTGLCGWSSVLLMLYITCQDKNITYQHLLYQNSGDKLMHNHNRVVGYHAMAIVDNKWFDFSKHAEQQLLDIAHKSLKMFFGATRVEDGIVESVLKSVLGAFVSVYVEGDLRGCIGTFYPNKPLDALVRRLVVDAAIYDNRFDPIREEELNKVSIEISVLGQLEPIANIDEIEIGRHGIYMRKGMQTGTLLPMVAVRNGWDTTEFLSCCSEKKACIGKDGWKGAELFVYETMVVADDN